MAGVSYERPPVFQTMMFGLPNPGVALMLAADYLAGKPVVARNPAWARESKKFRLAHPFCEACGTCDDPEIHHCYPVHLFPEMEMRKEFWITLCGTSAHGCHLRDGHAWNFKAWNPHCREDCARQRLRIRERKTTR